MKGKSQVIDFLFFFSLFCSNRGTEEWCKNFFANFSIFSMLLTIVDFGPFFHYFIMQNLLVVQKDVLIQKYCLVCLAYPDNIKTAFFVILE